MLKASTKPSTRKNLTPRDKTKLRALSEAIKKRMSKGSTRQVTLLVKPEPVDEEKKSATTLQSTPRKSDLGHAQHIFKEIKTNYGFTAVRQQKKLDQERVKAEERRQNQAYEASFVFTVLKNDKRSTSVSSRSSRRASIGLAKLNRTIQEARDAQQNFHDAEEQLNELCRCRLQEIMPKRSGSLSYIPELQGQSGEYGQMNPRAYSNQRRGSNTQMKMRRTIAGKSWQRVFVENTDGRNHLPSIQRCGLPSGDQMPQCSTDYLLRPATTPKYMQRIHSSHNLPRGENEPCCKRCIQKHVFEGSSSGNISVDRLY